MAKRAGYNPIKAGLTVLEFIDNLNSSFENMTRLAAYKALRDMGVEAKPAAEAVRELTTNFQQHGEWGPKINAMYGFANASIIGSARFVKTVHTSPLIITGLMAAGAISDLLNHLLEPEDWDKYTEEEKDGNFKLMLPDYIPFDVNIPAGYGLNFFVTVGRKMSELWRSKKQEDGTKLSLLEAGADVMYSAANAFAPVAGATIGNILAPSILDPVVNIINNRNNWGRKLYPDEYPGETKPQSKAAFDSTHEFWKTVATTMNAWTGGNDVVKGVIDVHPASFEHLAAETGGGLVRSVAQVYNLPSKLASGEAGPNDLPVLRRFATMPHGSANTAEEKVGSFNQRFYTAKATVKTAKDMIARYGAGSAEYKEYYADNKPVIDMAGTIKLADKQLRPLNTAKKALERGATNATGPNKKDRTAIHKATGFVVPAGKKLTDDQVAKAKKKIDAKREKLAEQFNAIWLKKVEREIRRLTTHPAPRMRLTLKPSRTQFHTRDGPRWPDLRWPFLTVRWPRLHRPWFRLRSRSRFTRSRVRQLRPMVDCSGDGFSGHGSWPSRV